MKIIPYYEFIRQKKLKQKKIDEFVASGQIELPLELTDPAGNKKPAAPVYQALNRYEDENR